MEAQACGRPVVAFGRGGALETVIDGETGVFFPEAAAASLAEALDRAAALRVDGARLRAHAEQFSYARYERQMQETIAETVAAPAGTRW